MNLKFIELRTKLFRLGIKNTYLAEILGVSRQYVNLMLNGKRDMKDKYKINIMQHTKGYVTPDDFFDINKECTNSSVGQQITKTQ